MSAVASPSQETSLVDGSDVVKKDDTPKDESKSPRDFLKGIWARLSQRHSSSDELSSDESLEPDDDPEFDEEEKADSDDDAPKHNGDYFSQMSTIYSNKADKPGGWPMKSPNPHAHDKRF